MDSIHFPGRERPRVGQIVTFNNHNPIFKKMGFIGLVYEDVDPATNGLFVLVCVRDRRLERYLVSECEIDVIQND